MAQRFPSVALIGASGNLGPHILQALRTAKPAFNQITVLTRTPPSPSAFPSDITVKVVDYTSLPDLTAALTGIDAVISAVPTFAALTQKLIIDASLAAGVKLFIPSEYGLDSTGARINADFPSWRPKSQISDYLAELKSQDKIDYALVMVGLFLDWGMEGILLDLKGKSVQLWDGGNTPISLTTVGEIAKTVVGVLEGKNGGKTELRVKNINISQRRLYELATDVVGKEGWTVTELDTVAAVEKARENIANGVPDRSYAFLKRAVVDGTYGSVWKAEEDDSELMGLKTFTEDDVLEIIRNMAGGK
ncbi:hypothetical protein QBC47DRAFT_346525 [Echria macrotheca]|uniref:NmrA-like domain-containing protein n=1 Tax=Echria macrotheca TaxID=438768 RepID=A0AAJ0B9V1_9PEZI|nr:hypothetical protein QBC47DRAFT_346525 [Echria macrotheca]